MVLARGFLDRDRWLKEIGSETLSIFKHQLFAHHVRCQTQIWGPWLRWSRLFWRRWKHKSFGYSGSVVAHIVINLLLGEPFFCEFCKFLSRNSCAGQLSDFTHHNRYVSMPYARLSILLHVFICQLSRNVLNPFHTVYGILSKEV